MLKPYYLVLSFLLVLFSTGCKQKTAENEIKSFNSYVEAFTSGKISRFSPMVLIFTQDVSQEKVINADLNKYIKIKPDIKGVFSFENNSTIIFKPAESFERDTQYKVSVDLSGWFDTSNENKIFTFSFSTLPLTLRANLESVDINPQNENAYNIVYSIATPDREKPEIIESLIQLSENAEMVWSHNGDEKNHLLTVANIPAGEKDNRTFELSIAPNKLGIKQDTIITTSIPSVSDFTVYEVRYIKEPERYVEITFTDLLDPLQSYEGLAYIKGNQNVTVHAEDNKLRLYPDNKKTGMQTIFLSGSLRSKNGRPIGEDLEEEIELINALPDVRFTGNGTIIPQSKELNVPFQAVYLRGVTVRIIKVLEKNIGQFLQYNMLNGSTELSRVGRLVARRTIFFDEEGTNLSEWRTYGLNLNEMIEPEPGAIYRIELSYNRDLSVYPCDDNDNKKTKEQIWAEDEVRFKEELSKFDRGGYYYNGDVDYDDYDYYERENPCSDSYYFNKVKQKNILATNLGLMAVMGENDEMTVMVHNLLTTYPERAVNISLYNYQHQIIGSGVTDDKGMVKILLSNGKPYYMIASQEKQRSYMRIDQGSALSLSSFDVSGEVIQKGIKGFIYGDRGVWRPGDTLFLSFMLNDKMKSLPKNHPVVMELFNPLGQSYLRKSQTTNELGLYTFAMPTEPDAPTGAWNVKATVGGISFTKGIRIESIKPNRLKINLTFPDKPALRGETVKIPLHTEWMHGAVARDLKYDVQATFIPTTTSFKDFSGYKFDDPSKLFSSEESKLIEGKTNNVGDATIEARFDVGNSAPGMLLANLTTRVYEESGDFSIDGANMLYSPYKRYIGIKSPQADKTQLVTDMDHTFDVVSVDYEGKPSATELEVEVYKVSWYWWWNSSNQQLANYIADSYYSPTKQFTVKTNADGKGNFKLNMAYEEWGTYLIKVKDSNGKHSTGIMSYFDWPDYGVLRNRDGDGSTSPTLLSFKTDKEIYSPGEKISVSFPSPEGSRAIINIENGSRLLSVSEHLCQPGETTIQIDATEEMQPNAYIYITLLQPHGNTTNDLPIRLYGVAPFTVSSPASYLHPVIQTPAEFKPEENYTVAVSEKNGRTMAYTLAIVDEGLLDLTRFPTPDPWKVFNAREALGVSTWDMYNHILGAYGGRIEQLFSIGGDDALNKGPKAIVNRFKPVVQFEGPFLLKKGETKRHTYKMPNYNGRVRIMVVAGDGSAYGHSDKSVMVRKPVMLLGTLPRVIGIGEEMVIPATVFATEDNVGNVKVSISSSDNMEVVGSKTHDLHFSEQGDKQALFRIRVKGQPGAGKVIITATGKGEKSVYETDIEIRSVRRPQTKVQAITLDAGKSWKENVTLPGMAGTNSLILEVSDVQPINLSSRLNFLLGYPHGCLEQITSKAFPQLYLKEFASLTKNQEQSIEIAVKEVIRRYRSYQMPEGAFSYWPGGSNSNGWGTVYAAHFMIEAGFKGYVVPDGLKRSVLNYIKRAARSWKPVTNQNYYQSEEMIQAYRLYVLALSQQAELGAMNRMKERNSLNETSKWLLASAYALVGREDVANDLITKTTEEKTNYTAYDYTYGSEFRDLGIRLQALSLLKKGQEAATVSRRISEVLSSDEWLSTQETAFALIGISSYMNRYRVAESMDFTYSFDGKSTLVQTPKNIWSETLFTDGPSSARVEIRNDGKATMFVRAISEGTPDQGEEVAYAQGVSINVSYQDGNGRIINVNQLPQGTNFTAVVTVKNPTGNPMQNLVVTEVFPAGWEILNTRFLHEGTQPEQTDGISYQDIRDDRVYSYIDNLRSGRQVTIRINLTTAYMGTFYLPPVYCESMYDKLIQANTEGRQVTVE